MTLVYEFPRGVCYSRRMKYQLVLQFSADSLTDYDRLVSLEDKLIEELSGSANIDGHDFGSGEFNIFILSDEPAAIIRGPLLGEGGWRGRGRRLS